MLPLSVPIRILGLFQQCGVFVLFILFHFTSNYLNIYFGLKKNPTISHFLYNCNSRVNLYLPR